MLNVYRVITTGKGGAKEAFGFVEQGEPVSKRVHPVKNLISVVGSEKEFQKFLKGYFIRSGSLTIRIDSSFHSGMLPKAYNNKTIERIVFLTQSDYLVSDEEAKKVYFIDSGDIFHNGKGYQVGVNKFVLRGSRLVEKGEIKVPIWFNANTYYPEKESPSGDNNVLCGNINVQNANSVTVLEDNEKIKKVYSLPTASQLKRIVPEKFHEFIF
jgi:hypothetical protein